MSTSILYHAFGIRGYRLRIPIHPGHPFHLIADSELATGVKP